MDCDPRWRRAGFYKKNNNNKTSLLFFFAVPVTRPCLSLWRRLPDGTRIYFRSRPHKLAATDRRPRLSEKSTFLVAASPANIQKKPLEAKGVNIKIGLFSSQDENLVTNPIYKKHTNRYLTATNQSSSSMRCELLSDGVRWVFHGVDRYVNS